MKDLKIATAQFENRSGDKEYNLSVIDKLSKIAATDGADIVAFHECSVSGYSFARHLSEEEMLDLAELIPEGPSVKRLQEIAEKIPAAIHFHKSCGRFVHHFPGRSFAFIVATTPCFLFISNRLVDVKRKVILLQNAPCFGISNIII